MKTMFCVNLFYLLIGLRFTSGQVYDDDLKHIGHPDEYLDITQYDENDLGHVDYADDVVVDEVFKGYWKVVDSPIVPNEPIIERPIIMLKS